MKFSIIYKDLDDNECSIENLIIDHPLWNQWYDEMKNRWILANDSKVYKGLYDTDECQELGKISWRHTFEILKWLDESKIEIKQPFYKPGKKLTITKC